MSYTWQQIADGGTSNLCIDDDAVAIKTRGVALAKASIKKTLLSPKAIGRI